MAVPTNLLPANTSASSLTNRVLLAAYITTAPGMGFCRLKAIRALARLVFAYSGYPLQLFLESSVTNITLRPQNGRRRSCPRYIDPPKAKTRRIPPGMPLKTGGARSAGNASRGSRSSSPVLSGRVTKRPQTRSLTRFPSSVTETKPQGLYNPHNYCYRRAILQCLLHLPSLYNHFDSTHEDCDAREGRCLPCALKTLFYVYWHDRSQTHFRSGRGGVESKLDAALKRSIVGSDEEDRRRILGSTEQSDAHEFLHVLKEKLLEQAEEMELDMARILSLDTESSWTCQDCNAVHPAPANDQKALGLNLPVPAPGNTKRGKQVFVAQLIEEQFERKLEVRCAERECADVMQLTAQLTGDGDKVTNKERTVSTTIARGPEVLVVHLQRNIPDFTTFPFRRRKLKVDVDYPEDLDLSKHTVDGTELKYRLFGVAAHVGEDVNAGHWIAAVRGRDHRTLWTISDLDVVDPKSANPLDFDELRRPYYAEKFFDPTVLFYVRTKGK